MADMGFDNIKLRGATVLWDEIVPDIYTGTAAITVGTAFFLNTNFYNLVIDSETDIVNKKDSIIEAGTNILVGSRKGAKIIFSS